MRSVSPDMSVFEALHKQPEFTEKLWQYVNRRCSDWRVITGRERAREYAGLLAASARLRRQPLHHAGALGPGVLVRRRRHQPEIHAAVNPALAALAWRDPRRRRYWERNWCMRW